MRPALLFALAASAATIGASPIHARSPYAVKGSHPVPAGWQKVARANTDQLMELRIGLTQGNFKELERQLYAASTPGHARFGKHMSADQVHELIKPSKAASDAVHEWLADNGIAQADCEYTQAKDWIKIKLPVGKVEELLDTTYHSYMNDDGLMAVRTPEWSLPAHLHEHVATIQPTNSFFGPKKQSAIRKRKSEALAADAKVYPPYTPPPPGATAVDEVCNSTWVTPLCLRSLYGAVNYTTQSTDVNRMSMNDFLGEVSLRSDTGLYLNEFRPEAAGAQNDYKLISIAGGTTQQTPLNATQLEAQTGIEGNLDVETLLGVAWPTPLDIYSTGSEPPFIPDANTPTNTNEPYLVWLDYILSLPDPLPSVVSTSYDDDEQTVPKDYAIQVCNMLAQLGARGTSVLFAAGDSGVGDPDSCFTNDGRNASTFLPEFPSTCPYVTAVGGTYMFNPEVPVFRNRSGSLYTGGGGFSNYFEAPWYQADVVQDYLSKTNVTAEYEGLFNPNGRGYPDISGQSLNFTIYWNGTLIPVAGTSASTPAVSGILALVNDALLAAGQSTLGFLNPWLYGYGYNALNDVTTGSNYGCDTTGFPAIEGWDAATGWGTPNFKQMLALRGVDVDGGSDNNGGWGNWS